MKKPHFWLSFIALFFGALMVLISIKSSVPAAYPSQDNQASHRQFYLSNSILPDHIAYPLLMMVDKIQLETSVFPDRLWLQVEYGWRRMDYAYKLIEKDKTSLAITAFTKSQKYLINASQEVLDTNASNDIKLQMLKHLTAYLWEAKTLVKNFDGADKAVADQLIEECEALKLRLSQSLSI